MTQLGVQQDSIVHERRLMPPPAMAMNIVASTLDRVKAAALEQNDAMLQMPIMTPVSADTWGVKEAVTVRSGHARNGARRKSAASRWKSCTASACSGRRLRRGHPEASGIHRNDRRKLIERADVSSGRRKNTHGT